ncbi:MAG: hypothetical protein Q7P63_04295 [Verrucomicrobiota bacterium JB022]|nr:hypothetical protein [Verrucomicrobiota bacterium JB022]
MPSESSSLRSHRSSSRSSSSSSSHSSGGGSRSSSSSSSSSGGKDRRYIVSLPLLQRAMDLLPEPEFTNGDQHLVEIEGRKVPFRKIKIKDSRGRSEQWIFDGKVLVS